MVITARSRVWWCKLSRKIAIGQRGSPTKYSNPSAWIHQCCAADGRCQRGVADGNVPHPTGPRVALQPPAGGRMGGLLPAEVGYPALIDSGTHVAMQWVPL